MKNPYQYLQPVCDHDAFFGRRTIVSKIYSRIGADRPQSVSIVGDPKIGKTSLLWYLSEELTKQEFLRDPENYIYIYIPIDSSQDFTFQSFSLSLCQLVCKSVDRILDVPSNKLDYEMFKQIVEKLHSQNKKIILFFDNFNLITQNESFPLEFFSFLRSLANNYNLAFVTSSYHDLQKLCVSKDVEESPFFNIFTNMTLKALEPAEARRLILEPAQKMGISLEQESEGILSLAGAFPFTLQVACNLIFERKKETPGEVVQLDQPFLDRFYEISRDYFEWLWCHFSLDQKETLKMILKSEKLPQSHHYIVKELQRKNYLTADGDRPQLFSPAFGTYIAAQSDIRANDNQAPKNLWRSLVDFFGKLFAHKTVSDKA